MFKLDVNNHNICFQIQEDNAGFLKPLDKQSEYNLFIRSKNGDKKATALLVEHNMRLVVHVSNKFLPVLEQDELISIGSCGLVKAVKTYDLEKGTQFSTYAAKCIENEILMFLRSNKKNLVNISLSQPIGQDKDGNEVTIGDSISDEQYNIGKSIEDYEIRKDILSIMKKVLTKREFYIIVYRYGLFGKERLPQREIARKLNISRSYISRIEKKALQKMRAYVLKHQIELY